MSWSDPWTADMPWQADDHQAIQAARRYIEKHVSDPAEILEMLGLEEKS